MKKNFALWLIASALLSSFTAAGDVAATDPRLGLTIALKATSPHPTLGDQAQVPGRLVGTWDVKYTTFRRTERQVSARVSSSWNGSWTGEPYRISGSSTLPGRARSGRFTRTCIGSMRNLNVALGLRRSGARFGRQVYGRAGGQRSVRARNAGSRQQTNALVVLRHTPRFVRRAR